MKDREIVDEFRARIDEDIVRARKNFGIVSILADDLGNLVKMPDEAQYLKLMGYRDRLERIVGSVETYEAVFSDKEYFEEKKVELLSNLVMTGRLMEDIYQSRVYSKIDERGGIDWMDVALLASTGNDPFSDPNYERHRLKDEIGYGGEIDIDVDLGGRGLIGLD